MKRQAIQVLALTSWAAATWTASCRPVPRFECGSTWYVVDQPKKQAYSSSSTNARKASTVLTSGFGPYLCAT